MPLEAAARRARDPTGKRTREREAQALHNANLKRMTWRCPSKRDKNVILSRCNEEWPQRPNLWHNECVGYRMIYALCIGCLRRLIGMVLDKCRIIRATQIYGRPKATEARATRGTCNVSR